MDELQRRLSSYANALGRHSETASRRCAIMICKSFRKNTKPAKKAKKIHIEKDNSKPDKKYISYAHGKKMTTPMRRYKVNIVARSKTVVRYADPTSYRKDIKESTGTNYYPKERKGGMRGLAKTSWGWVMHRLFSASPDIPFDRRKRDTRSPKDAIRESTSSSTVSSTVTSSYARISNKLDYIIDALKGYTPQMAIAAAMRWMTREIDRLTRF